MRCFFLILFVASGFGCAKNRANLAHDCPHLQQTRGTVARSSEKVSEKTETTKHIAESRTAQALDSRHQASLRGEVLQVSGSDVAEKSAIESSGSESPKSNDQIVSDELVADLPPFVPPALDVDSAGELSLTSVIGSVYDSYPSLEAAIHQRGIAIGEQISAQGAFDTKLKAASENTTVGFYENYRNSIGLVKPLYDGGELFAGYRVGRGSFEPWYKERQTNGGGEFKTGIVVPLAQNRSIDARRADLWRSQYERHVVEAEIQAQLISFVQMASVSYWEWVAAGESYSVAEAILKLAENRTERIRSQVENGLLDPPELTDNLRLIAERQAKLAQSSQKLQKAAIKLSLYYRGVDGKPQVPLDQQLPRFPEPTLVSNEQVAIDADIALSQRPELAFYNLVQRQLDIDYAQACNQLKPEVDAIFTASKDMGEPTSSKNDKGPFQLDASVFVDVPIQRRKAKGKIQSIESKVAQLNAKRRLTEDKIVVDVQMAYASLTTAYQQVLETRQAVKLAEELAQRERRNFELGASDLLKVTLREQYAVESQLKKIDALLEYFIAQANYRAALAQDRLPR